ncbi:MAG: hypothetical protein HQL31_08305, partial [Planctomycetes bacterium]|nr:hypothetical protein [Planctomycetota bacterium]
VLDFGSPYGAEATAPGDRLLLQPRCDLDDFRRPGCLAVSSHTGEGVDELVSALEKRVLRIKAGSLSSRFESSC